MFYFNVYHNEHRQLAKQHSSQHRRRIDIIQPNAFYVFGICFHFCFFFNWMNPNNVNPIHSSVEVAVAVAFAFIVIRNTVLIYSNEWNNEVVCLNGTCCLLVKQASFVLFFCIHHPIPLEHSHISYQFNLSTNPHIFTCFFFDCANFIFMWMITNYVTSNAFLKRKKSRVFFSVLLIHLQIRIIFFANFFRGTCFNWVDV